MMFKLQLVLLLAIALLAGCGQVTVFGHVIGDKPVAKEVKTDATATSPVVTKSGMQLVKTVTLVLSPKVTTQVANDSRFNAEALLDAVKAELRSRQLLDAGNSHANATAEISIDTFEVHPTTNAVVFGFVPSAGTLHGDIRVRDVEGNNQQTLRIAADAQFSIAQGGNDSNPLKSLYRRFAVLTGDSFAANLLK